MLLSIVSIIVLIVIMQETVLVVSSTFRSNKQIGFVKPTGSTTHET